MKRILLIAILLFPVVTLIGWLYWGSRPAQAIPNPPFQTNDVSTSPTNPSTSLPVK